MKHKISLDWGGGRSWIARTTVLRVDHSLSDKNRHKQTVLMVGIENVLSYKYMNASNYPHPISTKTHFGLPDPNENVLEERIE